MPIVFTRQDKNATETFSSGITKAQVDAPLLIETTETFQTQEHALSFRNSCFAGYRLANSVLTHSSPITFDIHNDVDVVRFYFNRTGALKLDCKQFKGEFKVQNGHYNILYSPELDTKMTHLDRYSEIFSLQLARDTFFRLLSEGGSALETFANGITKGGRSVLSPQWRPMSYQADNCIREILTCAYIKDLRKLYLQSKANELFTLIANGNPAPVNTNFVKRQSDRDKLYAIKDFITTNYASNISLDQLCRNFGINEYKLKKGFKELFNTSVIEFLIDQRLDQARSMLLEKDKSVGEIAYLIGYSSPQYFSKAFKKKYGISPGAF